MMLLDSIPPMDYAKLGSTALAMVGGSLAIRYTYKITRQRDDPSLEQTEKLTRLGWLALGLVILAGILNLVSDWQAQAEKIKSDKEAVARQDSLYKRVDSLLQEFGHTLSRSQHSAAVPDTLTTGRGRKDSERTDSAAIAPPDA